MGAEQQLPSPREGLPGVLDRFVGPGATRAELVLQFLVPLGAAGAAVAYAAYSVGTWSTVQYILCALLAFDIVGGIITNATSSGKRWYHRSGQGFPQHFGFITLHLAHLALVSWLFLRLDFSWVVAAGAYLLIAALAIISSPLYLQRPVALVMYAGSVLLALYALAPPPGMEWFLPLFYLKLLIAHLPNDEASRPKGEANLWLEPAASPSANPRLSFIVRPEEMNSTNQFYAGLTPFYHLIYPNWEASMQRQAGMLDSVIREMWGDITTILDVSCGIGTQAIGLAELGYKVTGSDLSPEEVERAKHEATTRNLSVAFSVADMRSVHDHHATEFDLVLSADNSVPHLLSDNNILTAFRQFHACTRPGGGCIVTVRDYEKEDLSKQQMKPYGIREEDGVRWLAWQVWDPHLPTYDVTMYFVEDRRESECKTHVMRSMYYAIGITRLMELMTEAGFVDVRRLDGRFFQPIIMGTRRAHP